MNKTESLNGSHLDNESDSDVTPENGYTPT